MPDVLVWTTPDVYSRSGMDGDVSSPADLGRAVRHARTSLGLSQEVVAAAAGVGVRFVVELEAGKPTVQLEKVLVVLAALGMRLALVDAGGG